MTLRRKLLCVFALLIFLSVAAVSGIVSIVIKRAFDRSENERATALFTQFQREFSRRGDELAQRVQAIAGSQPVARMAVTMQQASADSSGYFDLAKQVAEGYQLDFLEFVDGRGIIISSEQWPAKFGYSEAAFESLASSAEQPAFLKQEELQESSAVGLFAVRATHVGEHPVYVIGGRRLDKSFLSGLDLPPGMRALLYQNREDHFSPDLLVDPSAAPIGVGLPKSAQMFAPIIEAVRRYKQEMTAPIHWSRDEADDEVFHAIPLLGGGKDRPLLGILLIGNSRSAYVELQRRIRTSALLVGAGGIILAILFSGWAAARVTRPVEQLAVAVRDVAAGNWEVRVDIAGRDEVAQLAESFNQMTAELLSQGQRLLQAERVAAWRELARRLAHELKNPLFPLQLTVENLVRAREQGAKPFDEIFRESSRTLLAEVSNLKAVINRFSEFSKMPQPQLQSVQVNEIVTGVAQLFQAQLQVAGNAPIQCTLELDQEMKLIEADPELLHRAMSNLVLNALDAMPQGGTLALRTRSDDGRAVIEVADTGCGLSPDECARIFTPYYTSKEHGTGLGLAIVQSVVSDHCGRITVRSEPGRGTTFVIELPQHPVSPRSVGKVTVAKST
jgi:two-component system, NtrC family, nitrogen regulation sensor histidine kinase NtrY